MSNRSTDQPLTLFYFTLAEAAPLSPTLPYLRLAHESNLSLKEAAGRRSDFGAEGTIPIILISSKSWMAHRSQSHQRLEFCARECSVLSTIVFIPRLSVVSKVGLVITEGVV